MGDEDDYYLACGKCGEEAGTKLIGDEVYDWCDDCGDVEGCTEMRAVE